LRPPLSSGWRRTVKLARALRLAESLARGQPNRGRIALTIFRDETRDLAGG
jgi:hypothetical protein